MVLVVGRPGMAILRSGCALLGRRHWWGMIQPSAIAIVAHPDDIEFMAAGTLLLLKERGFSIHYMTVASGNCGSMTMDSATTREMRRKESQEAAAFLGATWHGALCDDLEIVYELALVRKLAAVIREVNPSIVLTHSPQDYMEDHMATSRLAVTAAFAKNMPNFETLPEQAPGAGDVSIYHGMPHGLCDQLRQPVVPDLFVETTSVHMKKREALALHASQKEWLDQSQGMDSYLVALDEMSARVGKLHGEFAHAEGWRRHLHLGFSAEDSDPLAEVLGDRCQSVRK